MPCKTPYNFFAVKPDGGLILSEGKHFSFKPIDHYAESFDNFVNNQSLTDDGSFVPSLLVSDEYIDSFKTIEGVGIGGSMGAQATADSCNTFSCFKWDSSNTINVSLQCSFKWDHPNTNPASQAEIFFINLRDAGESMPSESISNVSQRVGVMIAKRTDGDYELFSTDKESGADSLQVIPKAEIEYDTSNTNWIRFTLKITKTDTANRWDLSVTLESLGQDGLSPPTLITSNTDTSLYDNNIYNDLMYFQFFVYAFSSPTQISSSFVMDNLRFAPLV